MTVNVPSRAGANPRRPPEQADRLFGTRARRRARPAARGAAVAGAPLGGRDLLACDALRQLRNLPFQELRHTLFLAPDAPCEPRRVLVADGLGERLDRRVGGDLL